MTEADAPALDDRDWQIPAFTVAEFAPRRTAYAVVVPVINEGERIRSLLTRMREQGTTERADVIIVDGGSTDGSLAEDFLRSAGVRTLLVKTGPGRLSAQLRCAYTYVLKQGYEGVVTIDGNDKDDPDPIGTFLDDLAAGIDFVQASRFLPGGVAENTPLGRLLAIRLIHAPLLSLASGMRWTDTTQGFRAYSRRLLLHPGLAPFRDVFSGYELLAYMNARAPRLGMKCVERPTARRYPRGEIPTKISAVSGNAKVLGCLFAACLGRFNPPR
jgi:dolichol-phosphate mannosyltransferase